MAQIEYIKHLYEQEGKSLREIAKIVSKDFRTVQKYAYEDNWSPAVEPNMEPESYPMLGPYLGYIDEWLVFGGPGHRLEESIKRQRRGGDSP